MTYNKHYNYANYSNRLYMTQAIYRLCLATPYAQVVVLRVVSALRLKNFFYPRGQLQKYLI